MNRTSRAKLSFLPLLVTLNACGGRATSYNGIQGTEAAPRTGSDNGSAATRASAKHDMNGMSSGGNGAGQGSASRGATNGGGGTTNGNGGGMNDSGSMPDAPKPQVWVGYIRMAVTKYTYNLNEALSPQHMVLVLNPEGAEDVGSVILGDAPPPPPPTDPNAFYPPTTETNGRLAVQELHVLLEGVPYSLEDVRRTDARLTFRLNVGEVWRDWCKLRTDCSVNVNAVAPDHAPNGDNLCGDNSNDFAACTCEDSTCRWNPANAFWTVELELRGSFLEGQIAQGEQALGGVYSFGIRLERVE